jgi:hypothetical protein
VTDHPYHNAPDLSSYFDLLGRRIKDKVSGQEGVCDVITFDLYGCIQVGCAPPVDKDGKFVDGKLFDVHRIQVIEADTRVMPRPSFPNHVTTFGLLGRKVRDRISGMTGVLSSIVFDVSDGLARASISPPVDKDGKHVDGRYMAISRIEVIGDERVMPAPAFSTESPKFGQTPQQHAHGPADVPGAGSTSSFSG